MKLIVLMLSLLAVLVIAAPAAGKEPSAPAPATPALFLSRVDQIVISSQELSEWMARHKTRLELRDTNRGIEKMCDRLQDAERRMNDIASDPTIKPGDPQGKEIARFGEEVGTVARELATMNAALRRMAESAPVSGDSVTRGARERLLVRQGDLIAALDAADKHSRETHAWVIEKPAPRGLDEMSRDLDLARDELRGIVVAMGRLSADPVVPAEGLRELSQTQDCAGALIQALSQAQDRIESLAKTTK